MSPAVKYTLGRIGLVIAVLAGLWPVPIHIYVKLILAFVFSAALSWVVLRTWREQAAEQLAASARRRQAEKARLRAALAGEDEAEQGPARTE